MLGKCYISEWHEWQQTQSIPLGSIVAITVSGSAWHWNGKCKTLLSTYVTVIKQVAEGMELTQFCCYSRQHWMMVTGSHVFLLRCWRQQCGGFTSVAQCHIHSASSNVTSHLQSHSDTWCSALSLFTGQLPFWQLPCLIEWDGNRHAASTFTRGNNTLLE